jgi:predicted regulator of Ras-like GTPase activity (Roadblock/LC7/MglB family)
MSDDLTMDSGALIFATLADVYLSSGMIEEAISILKDGLSRNPTYSLAKVILGRAYYIKGDIEQSLKILEGEYNELKDSESTNLYIGHCYRKLGEYEKAAEYYNLTLKINPDNTDAKQGLEAIGTGVEEAVVEKHEEIKPIPEPEKAKIVEQEAVIGVALPLDTHEPTVPERGQPETLEPEKVEKEAEPPASEEAIEQEPEPVVEEKIEIEPASVKQEEVEPPPSDEKIEPEPVAEPEPAKAEQVLQPSAAVDIEKTEHKEPRPVVQKESVVDLGLETTETKKVEEPEAVFPLEALDKPMKRLLNMKTVKGAFICSRDGLLIKNYYEQCTDDIEVISAMIAAIHNEAQEAFKYLKEGSVEKFIIDKIDYPLCVITAGESLLTVVTQPEAKPGLVFVYARKIIEEIRGILG